MRSMKKRFAALLCTAAMVVAILPTTYPMSVEAKVLDGLSDLGRQVAAEGAVLIKNENKVLPLKKGSTVSVFGRMQDDYHSCGIGSGGEVKEKYTISIRDGLEASDKLKINTELKDTYTKWIQNNPKKMGNNWNTTPWSQEEMEVTKDIAKTASQKSDAAIIIIARTSGEDRDIQFEKGGYLLTDKEETMIRNVSENFDKSIVILNTTNIIDMSWVEKYPELDSVLYGWNGGQDGGHAITDLLTGDVNPSGKLTDTIAVDYTKYPSYKNYGTSENKYQEDIYVGYRYFETFAPEDVAYPFGYGLSYTTFETSFSRATEEDGYIKVVVSVTNTGDVPGKEVVQVYYGAPQNKLGNPSKELAAFAKTRTLEPGETQNISINFRIDDMASYDDAGIYQDSAYVLESGTYKIYVGNDVRNSREVYTYEQEETKVVEQLSEAAAPLENFTRYKAVEENGKIVRKEEKVPTRTVDVEKKIKAALPKELKTKDNKTHKLNEVYEGKLTMEQFVAQLTNEQLGMLAQGSVDTKDSYAKGCAAPFGGVRAKDNEGKKLIYLSDLYGIPVASCADGPSGVRISDYATQLPCGNVIGCTWNLELVQSLYEYEGKEMVLNQVDNLLGPGINIRRDPRCGRNFEYFSEDPLLSGRMAAAIAKGVQKTGATVTAKHFACNNQECNSKGGSNRGSANAIVSERALREIYLKVFEIYVKEGKARSIMTAYNPVNGCWSASHYDLNTEILRNEWGFEGIVMTDWWGKMSNHAWADKERVHADKYVGSMIKAQNDIWMTCERKPYDDNGKVINRNKINYFLDDIKDGYLTRAELQRSAVNMCTFLMKSQCFSRKYNTDFAKDVEGKFYQTGADWFSVEQAELGNPKVTGITVGGRAVAAFNPKVSQYKVYAPADMDELPKVEVIADEQTKVEIQQATKDNRTAIVKATEQKATIQYRIIFTDEEGIKPVLEGPVLASLSGVRVNGKDISGFDAEVYEYCVAVDSFEKEPEIVCETPEGVTAASVYDANKKTATIRCETKDQVMSYKFVFGLAPKSDEFNEATLSDVWEVQNESKSYWAIKDGHLAITAERGSLFQNENNQKNQFVQSAYGDWEVVAKLDLDEIPWTDYQSIGIVAKEDDDNYIYSKIEYSGGLEISYTQERAGTRYELETLKEADIAKFTDSVYLKMTKLGNTYRAAVSPDGKNYIQYKTAASAEYASPKFALVAGTGGKDVDKEIQAKFDFVRFKTDGLGDTVAIGTETKLKLTGVEPIAMSASLKPEECQDEDGGMNYTGTALGEYITYRINVEKTGYYDLTARIASAESELQQLTFNIYADNVLLTSFFGNGTGGKQEWANLPGSSARLTAGEHTLKIAFDTAGLNLNWIQFKLSKEINDTILRNAIEQGKQKDISSYPIAVQMAYKEALKEAEKVLESAPDQETVDAALAKLQQVEKSMVAEGAITGITSDIDGITIEVGKQAALSVVVEPQDHKEQVQWNSENEAIATVDANGMVTGISVGTTSVVASAMNGVQKKFAVTVINAENTQPGNGGFGQESEQPGDADNGNDDFNQSDENTGNINQGTGTDAGNNTIEDNNGASFENNQNQQIQNPSNPSSYIGEVRVNPAKTTLYIGGNSGKTTKIGIHLPTGAKLQEISYISAKPKVASVNEKGKITAKGKGTARITAKVTLTNGESKDFVFKVTVKKAYIKKVSVPSSVQAGKKKNLKAKAYGSSKTIIWKLKSGSKYAKITKKGKLTAMEKGTVKVTATAGTIKATFKIKIK